MKEILAQARALDAKDELRKYREQFHFPTRKNGELHTYLCGNSLGLQPKRWRKSLVKLS